MKTLHSISMSLEAIIQCFISSLWSKNSCQTHNLCICNGSIDINKFSLIYDSKRTCKLLVMNIFLSHGEKFSKSFVKLLYEFDGKDKPQAIVVQLVEHVSFYFLRLQVQILTLNFYHYYYSISLLHFHHFHHFFTFTYPQKC